MSGQIHRGLATMTLDTGKCPPWLFRRMVKLGREMTRLIVAEYGPDEFVRRLADPVWFQALGTVLAFDWNASGLTTILTAALKEAIKFEEKDLGIFICGGKKNSRQTPDEIIGWGERLSWPESSVNNLVYNSRMSAKVDSALLQDGFQLYHHSFFFSRSGAWAVVQQGMNVAEQTARRYHWFSQDINDLVCEPHSGIVSQVRAEQVLDLTAGESGRTRQMSVELIKNGFQGLMKDLALIRRYSSPLHAMAKFENQSGEQLTFLRLAPVEFKTHPVAAEDFRRSRYLEKILWRLCDEQPSRYETLLAKPGVGPKTIRALALVAEVVYGAKPSYEDPARYSFAHGGKDATPYPVDRPTYDQTIQTVKMLVRKIKISARERDVILQKFE